MSLFEISPKPKPQFSLPSWVVGDKVTNLFNAINERSKEIQADLLAGKVLTPSQYKIKKSDISKNAGLAASYINKHKNLNNYVDQQQKMLLREAEKVATQNKKAGYVKKKRANMKREEAIKTVAQLERELAERKSEIYLSQLNHMIDSGLSGSQQATKARIRHLSTKLQEQIACNASLEADIQLKDETIEALLEENRQFLKRIANRENN